jgi:hypothetical protein
MAPSAVLLLLAGCAAPESLPAIDPGIAVVPTLDTPLPPGRTAVWSAALGLAWDRLKSDVAGGPVLLEGAQAWADRLNGFAPAQEAIPPDALAVAGPSEKARDVMVREMAARFPGSLPDLAGIRDGLLIYSYLSARLRFSLPYFEAEEGIGFQDRSGRMALVRAFGIRDQDRFAADALRRQVQVLYGRDSGNPSRPAQFAIDLDRNSADVQWVVARVAPGATLGEMVSDVLGRSDLAGFGPAAILLVPEVSLAVGHRFPELEGKSLLNPAARGLHIERAETGIRFEMDRSGAALETEASIVLRRAPTVYALDGPFLLFMRRRGAPEPFFALWVEDPSALKRLR